MKMKYNAFKIFEASLKWIHKENVKHRNMARKSERKRECDQNSLSKFFAKVVSIHERIRESEKIRIRV